MKPKPARKRKKRVFNITLGTTARSRFEPALKILRQSGPIDEDSAIADIDSAVALATGYQHILNSVYGPRPDHVRWGAAKTTLRKIIGSLERLRTALANFDLIRWQHVLLVAADIYSIQKVSAHQNFTSKGKPAESTTEHEPNEYDLVMRDFADLERLSSQVLPRLEGLSAPLNFGMATLRNSIFWSIYW